MVCCIVFVLYCLLFSTLFCAKQVVVAKPTNMKLNRFLAQFGDVQPDEQWNKDAISKRAWSDYKRACLLNAGLSQGCDLSDMLMAKQQASKFSSFAGPGKKRR